MCGRYVMVNLKSFVDDLPWTALIPGAGEVMARYNVAPTQAVPVVLNARRGEVESAHWGLIPSWAKDASIGNRMINARAETLAEKPSFRTALKRRRCLVPADGFYEWKKLDEKNKQPHYIRLRGGKPLAFAGLWETWEGPEGAIVSCTIITTSPNALMATLHDRMPVILPKARYEQWMKPGEMTPQEASDLLVPYDADAMEAWPVGKAVGNPRNDSPQNIEPAA